MSEKIGIARAEIVDLLSLILRTHSRDELFLLFRSAEGITPKEDPEAWREDCRKRQAAGVKFQRKSCGEWLYPINMFDFSGNKEDYREVPQEVSASECQKALEHLAKTYSADKGTAQLNPPTPHAAERALWKAQREAGTNEVWQVFSRLSKTWCDLDNEPKWYSDTEYRVKPMKLTAKICRVGKVYPISYRGQDWEFFGTREEYRAECEKYGYVVISEINEVVEKPKTVKCYVVAIKASNTGGKEDVKNFLDKHCITIIGDIEEREISIE